METRCSARAKRCLQMKTAMRCGGDEAGRCQRAPADLVEKVLHIAGTRAASPSPWTSTTSFRVWCVLAQADKPRRCLCSFVCRRGSPAHQGELLLVPSRPQQTHRARSFPRPGFWCLREVNPHSLCPREDARGRNSASLRTPWRPETGECWKTPGGSGKSEREEGNTSTCPVCPSET